MIRTPQNILTRAPGGHVAGRWVDGAETQGTILASVQPAKAGDYERLEATLGGRRISRAVRIYTATKLNVAGEDLKNGDILVWQGHRYIVAGESPWRTTMLAHYRYLAIGELEP